MMRANTKALPFALCALSFFGAAHAQSASDAEALRMTREFRSENPLGYDVFTKEVSSGLSVGDLSCLFSASFPCGGDDHAITPQGITVGVSVSGKIYPLPSSAAPSQANLNRMISPGERSDDDLRRELGAF